MEMQRLLAIMDDDSKDLYDFARRCQRTNQKLRDVNDRSRVFAKFDTALNSSTPPSAPITSAAKTTVTTT